MLTDGTEYFIIDIEPISPIRRNEFKTGNVYGYPFYNGELCCILSDSGVGQSIYAVQLGDYISKNGMAVAYFDFEMNDKQLQMRYTDEQTGERYHFAPNFTRIKLNLDSIKTVDDNFVDKLTNAIERYVMQTNTKVFIIDDIDYLEQRAGFRPSIIRLREIKDKYGLSIIVLCNTRRRNVNKPILPSDIAGGKNIFDLFDSAFAIGVSKRGKGFRYIKELKSYRGEVFCEKGKVWTFHIEKKGPFLHFAPVGVSTEIEQL